MFCYIYVIFLRPYFLYITYFANDVFLCYIMCMSTYIHARTCVYSLNYHIVWCVRYRKKVLTEDIATRLMQILVEIGRDKGFQVTSCDVIDQDHVDCFVSAPPKISVTDITKYLKGISGRFLFDEVPNLHDKVGGKTLWNGSYFVETIGVVSDSDTKQYVERHGKVFR